MLYCDEINKEEFLDFIVEESNRKRYAETFKKTYEYEKQLGRDICRMNLKELLNCLRLFNRSKATLKEKKSRLFNYIEWCRARKYCRINWLNPELTPLEVIIDAIGAGERYYITPGKYSEYKEILMQNENGIFLCSMFMAFYEGLAKDSYENLALLRKEHIQREEQQVMLPDGQVARVSGELINLLLKTEQLHEFKQSDASRRRGTFSDKPYPDSIWKEIHEDNKDPERKFVNYMLKIKEILQDDRITKTALNASGTFHRVAEEAKRRGYDLQEDMRRICSKSEQTAIARKYNAMFAQMGLLMQYKVFKSSYIQWASCLS